MRLPPKALALVRRCGFAWCASTRARWYRAPQNRFAQQLGTESQDVDIGIMAGEPSWPATYLSTVATSAAVCPPVHALPLS